MTDFIYTEYLKNESLCDDIIDFFNLSTTPKFEGTSGWKVDKSKKDSMDTFLDPNKNLYMRYMKELQIIIDSYENKFQYLKISSPYKVIEPTLIQHYKPGQGYKIFHEERSNINSPTVSRVLVFMTYLNNVTDKGETEFLHQKIKIKPKKGLTVIWPADWTHAHRGIVSETQNKYIVTGWFNYY